MTTPYDAEHFGDFVGKAAEMENDGEWLNKVEALIEGASTEAPPPAPSYEDLGKEIARFGLRIVTLARAGVRTKVPTLPPVSFPQPPPLGQAVGEMYDLRMLPRGRGVPSEVSSSDGFKGEDIEFEEKDIEPFYEDGRPSVAPGEGALGGLGFAILLASMMGGDLVGGAIREGTGGGLRKLSERLRGGGGEAKASEGEGGEESKSEPDKSEPE